jgi:hypothetical protein
MYRFVKSTNLLYIFSKSIVSSKYSKVHHSGELNNVKLKIKTVRDQLSQALAYSSIGTGTADPSATVSLSFPVGE